MFADGMKQRGEAAKRNEWVIPTEHHAQLHALAKDEKMAQLRLACNRAQFEKAIQNNEPELAYEAGVRQEETLLPAAEAARDALWAFLHTLLPDMPADGMHFDEKRMVVKRQGGIAGLRMPPDIDEMTRRINEG